MRMRLVLLVVGLLMAGVLVAGCGGDDDGGGDGGGGAEAPAQTETGGGEATPEESGGDAGGGGEASDPQIQQAIESCEQQISAQPGISDELKADLQEVCQRAASGDPQEVREATKEVCVKIIEENVPEGPAREQALASCDQAAP